MQARVPRRPPPPTGVGTSTSGPRAHGCCSSARTCPGSFAGCWTVLRDILVRPGTIGQMIYDSKRVKVAAERLKDFFIQLKDKLPAR